MPQTHPIHKLIFYTLGILALIPSLYCICEIIYPVWSKVGFKWKVFIKDIPLIFWFILSFVFVFYACFNFYLAQNFGKLVASKMESPLMQSFVYASKLWKFFWWISIWILPFLVLCSLFIFLVFGLDFLGLKYLSEPPQDPLNSLHTGLIIFIFILSISAGFILYVKACIEITRKISNHPFIKKFDLKKRKQ